MGLAEQEKEKDLEISEASNAGRRRWVRKSSPVRDNGLERQKS
jgi:hypothetical protein